MKRSFYIHFCVAAVTLSLLCVAVNVQAQQQDPATTAAPGVPPVVTDQGPFKESLFFSPVELATIQKALAGSVTGTAALSNQAPAVIPQRRVIMLAGVVYKGPEKWIIWLNGQKVTPQQLLPEIMDIRVEQDRVHLEWFDIGINNVISLTLRPHQVYDIVTGVLLPG